MSQLRRAPVLILLAAAVAILALLAQSSPVHRAAAQAAATATPTSTATTPITTAGICGTVSNFTPATSTAAGTVTISTANQNETLAIAPGTVLGNSTGISVGSNVCLQFALSSSNAITSGQFVANTPIQIVVCGDITQYTAATSSAAGTLSIGGLSFGTALGSTFTGLTPTVGLSQSITATLNGLGLIVGGMVAAGNCPNGPTLSGPYTSLTPATATTAGSVTFGSVTFVIAAGSTLTVTQSIPLAASLPGGTMHSGATYYL